jgi:hypothetical protein
MPFQCIDEGDGLWVPLTGFAAPYEFMEVAQATAAHPARDRHRYHIFDFTGIDADALFALTEAIGSAHAGRSRELFGDRENPRYTALVSPFEKMQTVFQAFIDGKPRPPGHEIERFISLAAARTWLKRRLDAQA